MQWSFLKKNGSMIIYYVRRTMSYYEGTRYRYSFYSSAADVVSKMKCFLSLCAPKNKELHVQEAEKNNTIKQRLILGLDDLFTYESDTLDSFSYCLVVTVSSISCFNKIIIIGRCVTCLFSRVIIHSFSSICRSYRIRRLLSNNVLSKNNGSWSDLGWVGFYCLLFSLLWRSEILQYTTATQFAMY